MKPEKVMVAMSGGVDSTVAAALLIEQGYCVSGGTLKLFDLSSISPETAALRRDDMTDVAYAQAAAEKMDIPHHVFCIEDEFKRQVMAQFVSAYTSGLTPNPCVVCNRTIKFGKLLELALAHQMDYIATGHYAQVAYDETRGRYLLKKAEDLSKDQTYVLYSLSQEQLKRTLFPLGGLSKTAVRTVATDRGLVNADKPDSQDICFVPGGDYAAFIENIMGKKSPPGDFVDTDGNILGSHKGIIHYTIGQRRGLNMSFDRPKYVIAKDVAANTVTIGNEEALYSISMTVRDINLIALSALTEPLRATVKTRYSQKETPATLYPPENGQMLVLFDAPQRAVTPGQAAVFYDNDIVIGGGTIK